MAATAKRGNVRSKADKLTAYVAIGLGDLIPDPRNARRHTPRNLSTIVDSLHQVGAARSIVIDENGVILAGNATVEAAGQAGIERVQVVETDGNTLVAVRRTGLTQEQKTKLALADNRSAELAEWDIDVLAEIVESLPDITAALWLPEELAGLTAHPDLQDVGEAGTGSNARLQKRTAVKVVVLVDQIGVVERALAATDLNNRGDALTMICEAYLDAKR